jgi:hypothetical protein
MAGTGTVYQNAASWKGAEGGVYATMTQLTQQLPLEGQDAGTPKDTAYKYRARSLTRAYNGSVLHRSDWSAEAAAIAKGTGVRDMVEGAIGTAQLQQKAVTGLNIGDAAVDITKMVGGLRPTRTVGALPASPYTGYAVGDTIVLTTDNKLYRLTSSGWTKAVDGGDLVDATIAIAKMASGVRPTRTVSALPASPYTG